MKKVLCLILALMMVTAFAGCSANEPVAESSKPATESASTVPAEETLGNTGVDIGNLTEEEYEEYVHSYLTGENFTYYTGEIYNEADAKDVTGKNIAIVLPNAGSTWATAVIARVEIEAEKMKEEYGIEYQCFIAKDIEDQINTIQTIVDSGTFDAMTIFPVTGDDILSSAQLVKDSGMPVLVYGRPISTDKWTDTQYTGDGFMIGYSIADYFNKKYQEELDAGERIIVIDMIGDGGYTGMERTNSFNDLLDDRIEIVEFVCNWSRETAMTSMESVLNSYSEEDLKCVRAVYSQDDDLTRGVLAAIENYAGNVALNIDTVSGIECMPDLIYRYEELQSKGIELVELTYPPYTATYALHMMISMLRGGQYEDIVYRMPIELINGDNIDEYRKSDEFVDLCSLYGFDYEAGTFI